MPPGGNEDCFSSGMVKSAVRRAGSRHCRLSVLKDGGSDSLMNKLSSSWKLLFVCLIFVAGCDAFTDPATRLAYGIKAGAGRLGTANGSTYSIQDLSPATSKECLGPYSVQLDKVGALIVWCKDANEHTTASGSTSYHARFVDTPRTYIIDKPAGSTLTIDLERRNGRAVIVDVQ